MIITYKNKTPIIGKNVYIAPSAVVIGDVRIEDNVSIWFNAVVRGDKDSIFIGENTNIQDNCTIHVDKGDPVRIGANVTVGHNAVVHGCTVENGVLIGINAVILNNAVVGEGAIIGAGAVVTGGRKIAPYRMAAGAPAMEKKDLDPKEWPNYNSPVASYLRLKEIYQGGGDS